MLTPVPREDRQPWSWRDLGEIVMECLALLIVVIAFVSVGPMLMR